MGSTAASVRWYQTTVGKKVLVGVTGLILVLFLIFHLLGNLNIYLGRDAYNGYSAMLHALPEVLWAVRLVLLASIAVHITLSVQLALHNRGARPARYRMFTRRTTTYASRTMIWSGPIVAAYIIYHLLHLSLGVVGPEFREGDVYANVVAGFRVWSIAAFYILANALVGLHLLHGAWSFFQSLGWSHPRYNRARRVLATGLALFIAIGNISIPLAVLTGIVG
jgi:succinate dehydrogenase / fumarate reductase cytochrome b subunit